MLFSNITGKSGSSVLEQYDFLLGEFALNIRSNQFYEV